MSIESTGQGQSSGFSLQHLINELLETQRKLESTQDTLKRVRGEETALINQVNTLQKAVDTHIENIRKNAPVCTDWANRAVVNKSV